MAYVAPAIAIVGDSVECVVREVFGPSELAGDLIRTGIKRILGTQAPDVNNGEPVNDTLTLQPFDAIILLADPIPTG